MADQPPAPPDEFTELVRDALLHLYDLTVLQTHPLASLIAWPTPGAPPRGRQMRQVLLGAMSSLHPGPGVPTTSRAWRTYRLLELRYVEGLDVSAVSDQLALGRSHYHREHHRALQAVAASLWERHGASWPSGPAAPAAPAEAPPVSQSLAAREAEALLPASRPSQIDLAATVADVGALLEPLCRQRGVQLIQPAPAGGVAVLGDRIALRQALLTVAAQVVESLNEGEVTLRIGEHGRWADVTVSAPLAGGHGRPPAPTDESQPFVAALKGKLTHLPDGERPDEWGICLTLPTGASPRLLVVDNHPDFIRLVERYLGDQPWEVVGFGDIEPALHYAEQHRPQAILLDIVIPGRDGWELLQALKHQPQTRSIPVIICSVLSNPSIAIALGANAYLHKPVDGPQLVTALSRYV